MKLLYQLVIFALLSTAYTASVDEVVPVTTPKAVEVPVTTPVIPTTVATTVTTKPVITTTVATTTVASSVTTPLTTTVAVPTTTETTGFHCVGVGFYAMDNSCYKFYYCMRSEGNYVAYELQCPKGQNYMAGLNYCSSVYECSEQ